jgi:hypothetical protein
VRRAASLQGRRNEGERLVFASPGLPAAGSPAPLRALRRTRDPARK